MWPVSGSVSGGLRAVSHLYSYSCVKREIPGFPRGASWLLYPLHTHPACKSHRPGDVRFCSGPHTHTRTRTRTRARRFCCDEEDLLNKKKHILKSLKRALVLKGFMTVLLLSRRRSDVMIGGCEVIQPSK